MEPDQLLTTDEVEELIRTPRATLSWWRHVGTGPRSFKIGRRVMYRRSDVEAWLEEQYETTSNQPTPAA